MGSYEALCSAHRGAARGFVCGGRLCSAHRCVSVRRAKRTRRMVGPHLPRPPGAYRAVRAQIQGTTGPGADLLSHRDRLGLPFGP